MRKINKNIGSCTAKSNMKRFSLSLLLVIILIFGTFLSQPAIKADAATSVPTIQYRAHCQNIGWQGWVTNGNLAGTEGQGFPSSSGKHRIVRGGEFNFRGNKHKHWNTV